MSGYADLKPEAQALIDDLADGESSRPASYFICGEPHFEEHVVRELVYEISTITKSPRILALLKQLEEELYGD